MGHQAEKRRDRCGVINSNKGVWCWLYNPEQCVTHDKTRRFGYFVAAADKLERMLKDAQVSTTAQVWYVTDVCSTYFLLVSKSKPLKCSFWSLWRDFKPEKRWPSLQRQAACTAHKYTSCRYSCVTTLDTTSELSSCMQVHTPSPPSSFLLCLNTPPRKSPTTQ